MASSAKDIIDSVVRAELGSNVMDVMVEEDTDFEGDDVYRVRVIFDIKKGMPDPTKMVTLVRQIQEKLDDNVSRFPILSFISNSDARKMGIAAA